ncbi:MAG: hypothetical protein LVR00_08680 [Rhabdochlamydiaceae bacterium]|jgi:hypothetical protein
MQLVTYMGAMAQFMRRALPDQDLSFRNIWDKFRYDLEQTYLKISLAEAIIQTSVLRPANLFSANNPFVQELVRCLAVFQVTKPIFQLMKSDSISDFLDDLECKAGKDAIVSAPRFKENGLLHILQLSSIFVKFFVDFAVGLSFLGKRGLLGRINASFPEDGFALKNGASLLFHLVNIYMRAVPLKEFEVLKSKQMYNREAINVLSWFDSSVKAVALGCMFLERRSVGGQPLKFAAIAFYGVSVVSKWC